MGASARYDLPITKITLFPPSPEKKPFAHRFVVVFHTLLIGTDSLKLMVIPCNVS